MSKTGKVECDEVLEGLWHWRMDGRNWLWSDSGICGLQKGSVEGMDIGMTDTWFAPSLESAVRLSKRDDVVSG